MADDDVDEIIDDMKAQLGAGSDRDLAVRMEISPTAIANWRSRKRVPAKYILRYSLKRDEFIGDVRDEHSYRLLREAYVFCLVDILASRLNNDTMGIAPTEFFEVWKGFRLADGYSYFLDLLSSKGNRDELRKQFEAAKVEVGTAEFVEWLEGLGR